MTHRCHDRAFLLKFRLDRDTYRSRIREHAKQYEVAVLDYCITSNHVHLLVDAAERMEVSGFMREIASEFARGYNGRKHRSNAFWGDNYHATLVEDGDYLWQCLCYIDENNERSHRHDGTQPVASRIPPRFGTYRILFDVVGKTVRILHVRHGA